MNQTYLARLISQTPVTNNYTGRISHLPTELIELILNRVSVKDAVRTSALSRTWRYNWVTKKNLCFDLSLSYYSDIRHPMMITHHVLLQHRGSIDIFSIELPSMYSTTAKHLVYQCLAMIAEKSAKDVKIKYTMGFGYRNHLPYFERLDHRVLNPLFSCSELTSLNLVACQFKIPPSFGGFPNLVKLGFRSVEFLEDPFEYLNTGCPFLATLVMEGCTSLHNVSICSDNLKHLKIKHVREYKVDIRAKNLESLVIHLDTVDPLRFHTPFCSLKKLKFKVDSSVSTHPRSLLWLLAGAPNLQELDLWESNYCSFHCYSKLDIIACCRHVDICYEAGNKI